MGRFMLPAIEELQWFTICVFLINVVKLSVRSFAEYRYGKKNKQNKKHLIFVSGTNSRIKY
jgi:hypothetical protein